MNKNRIIFLTFLLFIFCCFSTYGLTLSYTDSEGQLQVVSDFRDTQNHWAHDEILKWGDFGIINGYEANFMPNNPIIRGDFCVIINNLLGLTTTTYNFYNDLPNSAYYRDAVLHCVAAEYIAGTGTNLVSPTSNTTREQAAVILCRIFNIDTSYIGSTGFVDDSKISSWARSSVYAMKQLGYMNGTPQNECRPSDPVTRAEMITLLNNICNTYIPKRDTVNLGTSFTGNYPINLVTSRNIDLINVTVGRDIVLTQDSSSITISGSKILGRILALGRKSISLSNTYVSQIVLTEGKSTVSGINEQIGEVYVAYYASESTIDRIPNKLVLEPGTRVQVEGLMYENTSTKTKVYYGMDLKANIAEEQGFVVGGPKLIGVTFTQDEDNTISVSNIKVVAGDSDIKEIGVIWLDQDDEEDVINPTYTNADGKVLYNSTKYDEAIGFTVNKVEGKRVYRVYVKDKDGLYAYSSSSIFEEFKYSINISLIDDDGTYPKRVTVEVSLLGENIPEVSSIYTIWDITENYSTVPNQNAMSAISNVETNRTYQTILSSSFIDGEETPPTVFGYKITFRDGTVRENFPVLVNAIPNGATSISKIQTGSASYIGGSNLTIKDNRITTRYIVPSEIGVAYLYSSSDYTIIPTPNDINYGWTRVRSNQNINILESISYDVSIPIRENTGYTYYCAYVKTGTDYIYGTVQKIDNNVMGDENGPRIIGTPLVAVLSDTSAIITFDVAGYNTDINVVDKFIVSAICEGTIDSNLVNKSLSQFEYEILKDYGEDTKTVSVQLNNLNVKSNYNISLQIRDNNNLKSNVMSVSFNTSNPINLFVERKFLNSYGWIQVEIGFTDEHCLLGNSHILQIEGRMSSVGDNKSVCFVDLVDSSSIPVTLECIYRPYSVSKDFKFLRDFDIQ